MEQRIYFGSGDGRRVKQFKADVQEKTIIDNLLLRFRPIAPKPVTGDSSGGQQKIDGVNRLVNGPRTKRKYVRVKGKKKEYQVQTDLSLSVDPAVKRKDLNRTSADIVAATSYLKKDLNRTSPESTPAISYLRGDGAKSVSFNFVMNSLDLKRVIPVTVDTWVTVESLTGTCTGAELMGGTELEKMRRLERDTCPGFISDGVKSVRWVNEAYKRMVMVRVRERDYNNDDVPPPEVRVCLAIKEKVLPFLVERIDGFGCWIRLQYKTWRQEEKISQMIPCDVWRMEFGGFAWRMDVTAALSLAL